MNLSHFGIANQQDESLPDFLRRLAGVIEEDKLDVQDYWDILFQLPDENMREKQLVSTVYFNKKSEINSYPMEVWSTYISAHDSTDIVKDIGNAIRKWAEDHSRACEVYDISISMGIVDGKDKARLSIYHSLSETTNT